MPLVLSMCEKRRLASGVSQEPLPAAAKRSAAQLREEITHWMKLAATRDAMNLDARQKEIIIQTRDIMLR